MASDHYLTKTDYIHYLQCPKSLWLLKHKPNVYPRGEFSDFLKKITREGYEVEKYAQKLFPGGVSLPQNTAAIEKTRDAIHEKKSPLFQATFHTDDGMFVRCDVLNLRKDGTYDMYEVKSSTDIKRSKKHDHIKDACFQMIAVEKAGLTVCDVFVIHVNADYVRGEEIEPEKLLKKVIVTDKVRNIEEETKSEVERALKLLNENTIDETGCGCYRKTRTNHCDAFAYFNGTPEKKSVWELHRVSEKKLLILLERGVETLSEVPDDINLNTLQCLQVRSAVEKRPIVLDTRIAEMLDELKFPLYFFDYETVMHAVPRMIGMRPWQQVPFQYSLHIMHEDGTLEHKEYVSDTLHDVKKVFESLCDSIGPVGSVVSWHASFERSRNREMGNMFPEHCDALTNINDRMFDLEDVFKEAYVDAEFCGSTSIKKVLPILCPQLSYTNLNIQDGTQAMERWMSMVDDTIDKSTKDAIREDLLAYCALDTYAMVELYRALVIRTESRV